MKKGLFIVFEGIDGSGKETQMHLLAEYIRDKDKYQDVLLTHEPWKNGEIERKLREDRNAYSDGEQMARLCVEDRIFHTQRLIKPNLEQGVYVLCDRYSLSTCAYQQAQGVELDKLIEMHKNPRILRPALTFFLDTNVNIALRRKGKEKREKFEYKGFLEQVAQNYKILIQRASEDIYYQSVLGPIDVIDGNPSVERVAENIRREFCQIYPTK